MVDVKKTKLTKTHVSIIIASSVLVFLIAGYVAISLILNSLTNKDQVQTETGQILEPMEGESIRGNSIIAYDYIPSGAMLSILVESDESSFVIGRPTNDKGEREDYYLFSYFDEDGNKRVYDPDILYVENGHSYDDFYSMDYSLGIGIPRVTIILSSLSALSFNDRIEPSENFEAQKARYGLDDGNREHIRITYLNDNGEEKFHDIYIGNMLISKDGYYFMIDDRECIYASAAPQFSYLLTKVEDFLHSRVVAEGIGNDGLRGPSLTTEYTQWKNTYYHANSDNKKPVSKDSEVIILADVLEPIYDDAKIDKLIKQTYIGQKVNGYYSQGYTSTSIDLSKLSQSQEAQRIINALVGREIGEYQDNEIVASYVFNANEAKAGSVYHYNITKIEAVLTDNGDIETAGTPVRDYNLVRVTYECKIDDSKTTITESPTHAVIDLNDPYLDDDVKSKLRACAVGDEPKDISWSHEYKENNATARNVSMYITEIKFVQKISDDGTLVPTTEITTNCIVKFAYEYRVDGVKSEEGDKLINFTEKLTEEGEAIKYALLGLKPGEVPDGAVYSETRFVQYMQDFLTYRIKEIKGFIEREAVVSFSFQNAKDRDPFYGETVYVNNLTLHALDDGACQRVVSLLGGVGSESGNNAAGYVGSKTVAVGLTPANMATYRLYDGYTVYFELPRNIFALDGSSADELDNYAWASTLGVTLYISTPDPDGSGIRYIGSDLYDIIVEVNDDRFDYLEKSFKEFWLRQDLIMIDHSIIDSVEVEIDMDDVFGSYEFDLNHTPIYIKDGGIVVDSAGNFVTEPVEGASKHNFVTVRTTPKDMNMSNTLFAEIIKNNSMESLDIDDVYTIANGGVPTGIGYDTAGASNFKSILRILYGTDYTGVLSDEEAEDAIQNCRKILSMTITLTNNSSRKYVYEFYRVSERKVMVHIYTIGGGSNSKYDVSGFYISTFAAKKIIDSFTDLLNGVTVNPEGNYWS